jgi:predicted Zn-dependent protease
MRQATRTVTIVLVIMIAASVCQTAGRVPPAQASLFGISVEQEIAIGRKVERRLAEKPGFVDDPALLENLADIGHRLAAVSERPDLPWTYHILHDSSVNAIAAPGGFIFATRGLFGFVKSQDELAFVIGHETTHVAHRHAVKQAQQYMEMQFGALIVGQVFHGAWLASQLTNLTSQLIEAKYSRDQEYEADHYGVIYAGKAGFDRTQSIAFFERLHTQEKTYPGLVHAFEDHPDALARIAALCTELTRFGDDVVCPVTPGQMTPSSAQRPAAPTPPEHN